MSKEGIHRVDVIQSASGVNVYSTIQTEGIELRRRPKNYANIVSAEAQTTQELERDFKRKGILDKLNTAEKLGIGALLVKDFIDQYQQNSANVELISMIAVLGAWIITAIARDVNLENAVMAKQRLTALRGAIRTNRPQYQQNFQMFREETG